MMPDDVRLPELSFPRSLAVLKVRGREETVNEHLVKLLAFDVPETTRQVWKRELIRKHFDLIAGIRVKPRGRPLAASDLFEWFYLNPFEHNEAGYAEAMIRQHDDEYRRNERSASEIAERVREFYAALTPALARGENGAELVQAL